jgi:hypothetical protein
MTPRAPRTRKSAEVLAEPEVPAALVPVVVVRPVRSVLHVCLGNMCRPTPKATVDVPDAMRIASAPSRVQAPKMAQDEAVRRGVMATYPDTSKRGGGKIEVFCPVHAVLGTNTTEGFALERALNHWEQEHGIAS